MEADLAPIAEHLRELRGSVETSVRNLLHGWRLRQLVMVAALAARPKWQLRTLLVLHRRVQLILFAVLP